jgi:hypothetical protein
VTDNSWFEGAESPGAGDLGQIAALHANLAATAEAARTARRDLAGLKDQVSDAVWRGPAAQEFKDKISGDFLGQLDKLDASYQDAADGFSAYLAAVSDIKDRADRLAAQIYAAQQHYAAAASGLQSWAGANATRVGFAMGSVDAGRDGSPYTVAYVSAPAATGAGAAQADANEAAARAEHARLQSDVEDAWNALQSLYRQMQDLKDHDRAAADNAVVNSLNKAHDAGIQNESGWAHFFHALSVVGEVLAVAVLVVAVVAVVLAFPEILAVGLPAVVDALSAGGALLTIGEASLSLGSVVQGLGALASVASLAGNLGEGGPVWKDALYLLGVVPGIGVVGKVVSRAGGPAVHVIDAIGEGMITSKLAVGMSLETLGSKVIPAARIEWLADRNIRLGLGALKAQELLNRGAGKFGLGLVGYGYPTLESPFDKALFGFTQYQTVKDAPETFGFGGEADPSSSEHDVSSVAAQAQILGLQRHDPVAAARAHDIAVSLASGHVDGAATAPVGGR